MDNTFDERMKTHNKSLNQGRKMMLSILLSEIKTYNYMTFNDLHGAIKNHLDIVNDIDKSSTYGSGQ